MNQTFYPFTVLRHALRFEFVSIGKKNIRKAVIYTKVVELDFYSIALLDIFEDETSDDKSVSDNGDMEKILATVYQTVVVFFKHFPNALITFTGSTPSRTRLYRIAINHEILNLDSLYNVWGIINELPEMFQANQPYTGFILSRKSSNIA